MPADSAHLGQARQFAGLAARAFGFPQEAGFEITMAVSEVVANAVEHGSTSSEDLIRLRAVEEDGALVFYVTDVGTFTPPAALAADILSDRGRGLTLIRWLMDELDVRPGYEGTVIRFAKRLAA